MKLPHFIVTPDAGDLTLDQWLIGDNGAPPPLKDKVTCIMKLADALDYAHAHGCVHGGLRPSEVRFDKDGEPMLSGFQSHNPCGKKYWQAEQRRCSLEDFQYSSPEYRDCGVVDEKGDQYLLGLLAYEMISGGSPVRLESWGSILDPATAEAFLDPMPLEAFVEECDDRLSDIVMRMLSPNPEKRWGSLDAVKNVLEHYCENVPVEAALATAS